MVSTAAMPAKAEPPAWRYCLAIRGRFVVLQGDKDPIGLGIEVAERPLRSAESEGAIPEGTQRLPMARRLRKPPGGTPAPRCHASLARTS